MTAMTVRPGLAPKFYFGRDAVLFAMDNAGVNPFRAALTQAQQQGSSRLDVDEMTHQVLVEPGAAEVQFQDAKAVWRIDHAKAAEIIELLTDMSQHPGAGHHYVDISAPAATLVISVDEYA